MKLYEKYYASNYEELITYYPSFYREVFEMVEILKTQGRIADSVEGNIEQAYLNGFIDYADEATISKLEKFLEIGLSKNRTFEERRRLVKSYFVGFGKVSASMICQMISVYTNAPVSCRFEPCDREGNNILYVDLQLACDEITCTDAILPLLSKKVPAHILYRINYCISILVDHTRMEKILLPEIRLHMGIPFWGGVVLDGSWLMDGSILLNSVRRYGLALRLYSGSFGVSHEALQETLLRTAAVAGGVWHTMQASAFLIQHLKVDFPKGCVPDASMQVLSVKNVCKIAGGSGKVRQPVFGVGWKQHTHGDAAVNAVYKAEVQEAAGRTGTSLAVHAQAAVPEPETAKQVTVETKTPGYWFMDGSVPMDGTRSLNSVYRKEVAQ